MLRRRGHRVVFIAEESFEGTLAEKGFEERLMRLTPPSDEAEDPGQFWKDFIRDTAPVFRSPRSSSSRASSPRPSRRCATAPATSTSAWSRSSTRSAPTRSSRTTWSPFPPCRRRASPGCESSPATRPSSRMRSSLPLLRLPGRRPLALGRLSRRVRPGARPLQRSFDEFCRERGAPALPDLSSSTSPDLNLWLYPAEVDYPRERGLGDAWHNLESSVRATDAEWLPSRSRARTARSSTSASARSARPTSS